MDLLKIIEYQEEYKNNLIQLSYEWLEKYNLLEPKDECILNHPKENVLNDGGYIFFAKYDNKIVGTVSLIKTDKNTFELAKLAVNESYQNRKIGRMLIDRCIQTARQAKAEKIILYTNHILTAAIHLYDSYGFKEIAQYTKKYIEVDMKMELYLK